MCPLFTIGTGAAAFTVGVIDVLGLAFSVASGVGQMQAGKAQQKQDKHNAHVAEYNAKVAENDALAAQYAAQADADTVDRRRRIAISKEAASRAKSGFILDEGTTLETLGNAAAEFELERASRLHQGEVEKRAALIKAQQQRHQAAGSLMEGRAARTAGQVAGGVTILGGSVKTYKGVKRGA